MQEGRKGDHALEAGVNSEGKWDGKRKEWEKKRAPRRHSWDITTFMKQRAKDRESTTNRNGETKGQRK